MRAAQIIAPGQIRMQSVPVPEPSTGEVRVRVEGTGVCASNLGQWHGLEFLRYPQAPALGGHEAWGVVESLGPGVQALQTGERVAVLSDAAFAEHVVVPELFAVPLPAALAHMDVPAEPLGCAVNIFKRSNVSAGQTVLVLGIGFLGALLVRMAVRCGARVAAASRRRFALSLAEQFGAEICVPLGAQEQVQPELERRMGVGEFDRVIECTGKQAPLELAGALTAVRGRLIIAGYHQDGARRVNMQLWNWRGLDVINAHEREPKAYLDGMRAGVEAVARGELPLAQLLTHRFRLEHLDRALNATAERPDGFMKAVVKP